jgi:hypothetical protein
MNVMTYFNACFDAGDIASAAACILADPVSMVLQQRSVDRLYRIAFDEQETTRCDVLMVEIIGDIMAARYRQ